MGKKLKGRPRKYTDEELIEIIKLYIIKNKKTPIKLKPTSIAEYGNEIYPGSNFTYQDFTRKVEVKKYIDSYNNKLKSKLSSRQYNTPPIYSTLDIDRFLEVSNTEKKMRQNLAGLNQIMSDLVKRYTNLEEEFIKVKETNLELNHKLNKISVELSNADKIMKDNLKEEKKKRYKIQQNNTILRKKVFLYEYFIKEYHLDEICKRALELEGNLKFEENNKSFDIFKNKEKYKTGEYDLVEVVKGFQSLIRDINFINSDEDDDEEATASYTKDEFEALGNELIKEISMDEDTLIHIEEDEEDGLIYIEEDEEDESIFVDFDDFVNIFNTD